MAQRSPRRLAIAGFGASIALVFVAVACSTGNDPASTPSQTSTVSPRSTPTPVEPSDGDPGAQVPEVLRFTAPRLSGGAIDGEDLSGRDVAFWFWAPW
jgi:hypothetical protein